MNGNYFRLVVSITIKAMREANDVQITTSRTIPFMPVEGLTLVITNDAGDEHEMTLGPPRYEYAESAFVEYQEDDVLIEAVRDGTYTKEMQDEILAQYKSFGFKVINAPVIEQVRAQA